MKCLKDIQWIYMFICESIGSRLFTHVEYSELLQLSGSAATLPFNLSDKWVNI